MYVRVNAYKYMNSCTTHTSPLDSAEQHRIMSRYRDDEQVPHIFQSVELWEAGIKGVNSKQEEQRERQIPAGDITALLC